MSAGGATCASLFLAYDIQQHRVYHGSEQTFAQAARHYMVVRSLSMMGKLSRARLERATQDVKSAQREFLLNQLEANMGTQYNIDMGVSPFQHLKRSVPPESLATYLHM